MFITKSHQIKLTKLDKKFGENLQDYRDGSGLQFIKFDFVTGSQETQLRSWFNFEVS